MNELDTIPGIIEFLVKLAAGEGLALLIVVGGGAWGLRFFSKQFWPWYTNTHRPAQISVREKELTGDLVMAEAFQAIARSLTLMTSVVDKAYTDGTRPRDFPPPT